jgi:arabinogalactan endo-1,4-beta-galactosidase
MPEDNEFWADKNPARGSWWNASLYVQNTGMPLAAMFELQRFIGKDPTGIASHSVSTATEVKSTGIYDLNGRRMPAGASLPKGIYIRNGKKTARP